MYSVIIFVQLVFGQYLRVFIAMKRCHDHGNSYKGKHLIEAGLQFGGLVHYHHCGKHGEVEENTAEKGA